MPDYGHDLLFGCFLPPLADQAETVVTLARLAEAGGLDLVTVQDHPYQPRFLDTWTLLSVLAARTSSVRLLPNVANLPLRPPAVLARSAASLDILSEGRVELGLGAGAFWDGIEAMGGPRRSPGEAVTALEEAISVIRALWTPGRTPRIDGEHYRLQGAKPGPFPVHDIGIWLGAYGPRMLAVTGRLADGWLPSQGYAPPDRLAGLNGRIDDAAVEAGREPGDVRRLYNLNGSFGTGTGFLEGSAADWAEQLAELALRDGMSGFVLSTDVGSARSMQRFAEEVAPAVRLVVERERTPGLPTEPAAHPAAGDRVVTAAGPDARDTLGVTPTADDGRRLSDEQPWDESTRPEVPAADPVAGYTPLGRRDGLALVQIHDHLRAELVQLRDLVDQVTAGNRDVGEARSLISTMTMRQNSWTLGTYCETYCRVVTVHHTIEDQGWFPRLREAEPALAPVVDRLAEEHEVIAAVLERVDAALVGLVARPGEVAGVRRAVDLLTDALLSHLSYEERALVEPLARLDLRLL
jgi:alkanesulfonate monooxygenase SsuD/methylene tetrahydromethanopterin reductase-like flavin-dependent oxidoreductase (luciferase family)